MRSYDIAIIGASLSGSSLALQLANDNFTIALIDAQTFPRRKPCGEGLSHAGVKILRELGLKFDEIPHGQIRGYRLHWKHRRGFIPLADEEMGFGVDRWTLDAAILKVLHKPNVTFYFDKSVRSFTEENNLGILQLADGEIIRAKYVVAANGAGRSIDTTKPNRHCLKRYAYSQHFHVHHFRNPTTHVHIILRPHYEIYVTPLGAQSINVAVMGEKKIFKYLRSEKGQASVRLFIEEELSLKLSEPSEILSTGPLGNLKRPSSQGRLFFVGDACEQFDPIGGMGMTHALLSSRILADHLKGLLKGELSLVEAANRYERLRNRAARPLRGFTRLTYFMLVALKGRLSETIACSRIPGWVSKSLDSHQKGFSSVLSKRFVELAGR